jgi:hypothetical protein
MDHRGDAMSATVTETLTDDEYHRLESLSNSGLKLLLQEGGPARYRYWRDHPEPPKPEYEEGSAFHTLMLGIGAGLVEVDADSWRTKAAKQEAERIRSEGGIPLLPDRYRMVHEMFDAAMSVPVVAQLFEQGVSEHSIQWTDTETGVHLRCRPDWLRPGLVVDLKTTNDASPKGFGKSVVNFGYDTQDDLYRTGCCEAMGWDDCAFVFVVTEKAPPYMTAVYELDDEARAIGRAKVRRAIEIYRDCTESGLWPGYGAAIQQLRLPKWATYEWDNQ